MTRSDVDAGAWIAFAELAGPVLLVLLLIGIVTSALQAATQIKEASVPFVLKLAGVAVLTTLAGPLMLGGMERFALNLFNAIPGLVHG